MYNDSFKLRYKTAPVAISETNTFFPTKPHNHGEIEILLILKGACEVRIGGNMFAATKGDMLFINPLEVHSVIAYHDEEHCHRCVCFDVSLIADSKLADSIYKGECILPALVKSENPLNGVLRKNFEDLYFAVENDVATIKFEAPSYVNLMMAYIIKNSMLSKKTDSRENTFFCDRVLKYIAENYGDEITSKQAAEALSFNQSYFCRSFKRNFGMSFSNYLNMYRISASKKLIENSNENIANIAFKCGFQNPDYFTKCFKSFIGISPTEYKKLK